MLDLLGVLVEKSLVARVDGPDGEPRFLLLGTIRDYALERLEATGTADDVRRRHAAFFLGLAERAEPELTGPSQRLWSSLLDAERGNLDAALEWSCVSGAEETALRLGAAHVRFWSTRGTMREGLGRLETALAGRGEVSQRVRARGLFAAGYACVGLGDFGRAGELFEESAAVARAAGEPLEEIRALGQLAWLALAAGDVETAEQLARAVLEQTSDARDAIVRSGALSVLADVAEARGALGEAAEGHRRALALRRRAGDARLVSHSLLALGRAERTQDAGGAERLLAESLQTARSVGDTWLTAAALVELSRLYLLGGDPAQALSPGWNRFAWTSNPGAVPVVICTTSRPTSGQIVQSASSRSRRSQVGKK